jgi:hypothetical protein
LISGAQGVECPHQKTQLKVQPPHGIRHSLPLRRLVLHALQTKYLTLINPPRPRIQLLGQLHIRQRPHGLLHTIRLQHILLRNLQPRLIRQLGVHLELLTNQRLHLLQPRGQRHIQLLDQLKLVLLPHGPHLGIQVLAH